MGIERLEVAELPIMEQGVVEKHPPLRVQMQKLKVKRQKF
jgi:hypothetical protein